MVPIIVMRISNIYKRKKRIKPSIKVRNNSTIISFKNNKERNREVEFQTKKISNGRWKEGMNGDGWLLKLFSLP